MAELIQLPLQHYLDRYRKAYNDLLLTDQLLGGLKAQRADLKQKVEFFEQQYKLLMDEVKGAELALRSAVVMTGPEDPGIPGEVVDALSKHGLESFQPKPEDPKPDKGNGA